MPAFYVLDDPDIMARVLKGKCLGIGARSWRAYKASADPKNRWRKDSIRQNEMLPRSDGELRTLDEARNWVDQIFRTKIRSEVCRMQNYVSLLIISFRPCHRPGREQSPAVGLYESKRCGEYLKAFTGIHMTLSKSTRRAPPRREVRARGPRLSLLETVAAQRDIYRLGSKGCLGSATDGCTLRLEA